MKAATQARWERVYDRTRETPETMRERAVQLKTQLADKLETGATKLRKRSSDTEKLDDAIATTKERVADAGDRVASGMEKSAEWLRSANMTSTDEAPAASCRATTACSALACTARSPGSSAFSPTRIPGV